VRRVPGGVAIVLTVALISTLSGACSLLPGYFHQVTAIRGRVVGTDLGPFQFRWLRQSFNVTDATLTLYEYRPQVELKGLKAVAATKTNSDGEFDFGTVAKGHYSLLIDVAHSHRLGGWFDVEVTDKVAPTKNIVVDVSPIRPDCTGGHEFIESKKS